jgi:RNA polymerase sigma-70 factor (ECF subfamily)
VAASVRLSIERALRDEPLVTVVCERRADERRLVGDRRGPFDSARFDDVERRRVRYGDGRRIAERRATLFPVVIPNLPSSIERLAPPLAFVEPLDAPPELEAALETVRAIVRFQAGEADAFMVLYRRWFDPLYAYLRIVLDDPSEVDQRLCAVFSAAIEEIPRFAPGPAQIRAWLFAIAYRVSCARALGSAPGVPAYVGHGAGDVDDVPGDVDFAWLTDEELLMFVERRPPAERHALALRYLAGLSFAEIADVMGLARRGVADLHRAAIRSLEATLTEVARSPRVGGRLPMSRLGHETPVLYRRRRALLAA